MFQSHDDNIIIEDNEWHEISDCLNESTNRTENCQFTSLYLLPMYNLSFSYIFLDEVRTSNISNVDNIQNPELLTSKRSRWCQSQPNL